MPYIYQIINDVNGKIYVGKTIGTLEKRFKEHCRDANKKNTENRPLYRAIKKYGVSHFHISLLEEVDISILNEKEKFWIEKKESFKYGYNATVGGDGSSYLDYNLIYSTYQKNNNLNKTAKICNCNSGSVSRIVKIFGETPSSAKGNSKKVAKLDIKTKEIIEIYSSVNHAERENGNTRHIADVCNGKRKSCKGYSWKYI